MSKMRPELQNANADTYSPKGGTAYLMIFNAVQSKDGLIHGHLHEGGASCAIGAYFDINDHTALSSAIIDEVATVNDSAPTLTPKQRKRMVTRWLRWKLQQLGMSGFRKQEKVDGRTTQSTGTAVVGSKPSAHSAARTDDAEPSQLNGHGDRGGHRRTDVHVAGSSKR